MKEEEEEDSQATLHLMSPVKKQGKTEEAGERKRVEETKKKLEEAKSEQGGTMKELEKELADTMKMVKEMRSSDKEDESNWK